MTSEFIKVEEDSNFSQSVMDPFESNIYESDREEEDNYDNLDAMNLIFKAMFEEYTKKVTQRVLLAAKKIYEEEFGNLTKVFMKEIPKLQKEISKKQAEVRELNKTIKALKRQQPSSNGFRNHEIRESYITNNNDDNEFEEMQEFSYHEDKQSSDSEKRPTKIKAVRKKSPKKSVGKNLYASDFDDFEDGLPINGTKIGLIWTKNANGSLFLISHEDKIRLRQNSYTSETNRRFKCYKQNCNSFVSIKLRDNGKKNKLKDWVVYKEKTSLCTHERSVD